MSSFIIYYIARLNEDEEKERFCVNAESYVRYTHRYALGLLMPP
jgi:hypothetical protein